MSSKVQAKHDNEVPSKQRSAARNTAATEHTHPATTIQRARFGAASRTPRDVLQLQRTVGNQAVQHLLQSKSTGRQLQRKPSVKVTEVLDSSDPKQARQKGREMGKRRASGNWTREDTNELSQLLGFFRGRARDEFIQGLSEVSGDTAYMSRGKLQDEGSPHGTQAVFERSLVIPVSPPRIIRGGFKVSYSAQIFEEDSDSISVEVYTDASVGAELSAEIPIFKVAKLKFSASVKKGVKSSTKAEHKKASRKGMTISRGFTIKKLSREIMRVGFTSKEYNPSPGEVDMTREAEKIKPQITDVGVYGTQEGYQIIPDEGGDPWVPFWKEYLGYELVEKSAVNRVWEVLKDEQRKIAEDLVAGG